MTGPTALSTTKLTSVFRSGVAPIVALDGVDIELMAGEFTLLMGPSGSGKSTLLAALGGLQPPTSGAVRFKDQSIWDLPSTKLDRFRRENCGFVFQSGGLFDSLTALQQIAIPLTYFGYSKPEAIDKARHALAEVDLADRQESLPVELSGGQNQRVAIARMLAKDPYLVFCDEPTSALDSHNGAVVAQLLRRAARKRNAMVLCVTHDDRLRPFADRILQIEDGRITADARPEASDNGPTHERYEEGTT